MIDEGGRADLNFAAAQHVFAAMPSATSDPQRLGGNERYDPARACRVTLATPLDRQGYRPAQLNDFWTERLRFRHCPADRAEE